MQLVIGNKRYSSWSMRPWLLLHGFGLAFDEVNVSLNSEGVRERLLAYSGSAKVPVLLDNELHLWDSLAICEYINEIYLAHAAWPKDASTRAIARALTCEMHSGFTQIRNAMPLDCKLRTNIDVSDDLAVEIDRVDHIWAQYSAMNADGEIFLLGQFSILDCFYAPVALRFKSYGVKLSLLAQAYADSLIAHSSVQAWLQAADTETEVLTHLKAAT
ncbi:glutathione S-transferase family protein [Alginatibacterium sediminis]|uniref:Glutathione S-transferase family protein n=1 Tax=Alginatibacterium sediminis TaxID=2164068 RepID=A0A420E9P2_9ALTE|nr:glutathione S-transferase family protein [Alginatibacterium sediminis]RKF17397.1 glutathione S-transferase family protein [Alginatibacterium sediminis]